MELNVRTIAEMIDRFHNNNRQDRAFLSGIAYALYGEDLPWQWDRFVHDIYEELNIMKYPEHERQPFYTEKMYYKRFNEHNHTCSYDINHCWNETICRTEDKETPDVFVFPASGWWECDTRWARTSRMKVRGHSCRVRCTAWPSNTASSIAMMMSLVRSLHRYGMN